jgi:hypothetical protein
MKMSTQAAVALSPEDVIPGATYCCMLFGPRLTGYEHPKSVIEEEKESAHSLVVKYRSSSGFGKATATQRRLLYATGEFLHPSYRQRFVNIV